LKYARRCCKPLQNSEVKILALPRRRYYRLKALPYRFLLKARAMSIYKPSV